MSHELSCSDGGKRKYRYYRCSTMVAKGSHACPSSRVPAGEIESFVVDRIREIGRDPRVLKRTIAAGKAALDQRKPAIHRALKKVGEDRERLKAKQRRLVLAIGDGEGPKSLVKELEKTEATIDETKAEEVRLRNELAALTSQTLDGASLKKALADFDHVWGELFPEEQARVVQLLVEKITCDVPGGQVQVTFRPGGIKAYAEERTGDGNGDVPS